MPRGMEVGLGHTVLDGTQLPPTGDEFSAHVCCGQMAGWIKMSLGTEIGLGPGHIVLDGDTVPLPERGTAAPLTSRPMSIVAKRWPISATAELLYSNNVTNFHHLASHSTPRS